MEAMSSTAKQELYELIDNLPESEVPAARRYLEFLRLTSPESLEGEPFASMPPEERARLHAVLAESRAQHERGEGISADEAAQRLRSL